MPTMPSGEDCPDRRGSLACARTIVGPVNNAAEPAMKERRFIPAPKDTRRIVADQIANLWFNFAHLFSMSLLPLSTVWMAVTWHRNPLPFTRPFFS